MLIVELENLFFLFTIIQLITNPLQVAFRAGINPAPTSLAPRVSPRRRFSPSPCPSTVPSAQFIVPRKLCLLPAALCSLALLHPHHFTNILPRCGSGWEKSGNQSTGQNENQGLGKHRPRNAELNRPAEGLLIDHKDEQ